jgi:hypothetical protein
MLPPKQEELLVPSFSAKISSSYSAAGGGGGAGRNRNHDI